MTRLPVRLARLTLPAAQVLSLGRWLSFSLFPFLLPRANPSSLISRSVDIINGACWDIRPNKPGTTSSCTYFVGLYSYDGWEGSQYNPSPKRIRLTKV